MFIVIDFRVLYVSLWCSACTIHFKIDQQFKGMPIQKAEQVSIPPNVLQTKRSPSVVFSAVSIQIIIYALFDAKHPIFHVEPSTLNAEYTDCFTFRSV